jgi:hypothetical protein
LKSFHSELRCGQRKLGFDIAKQKEYEDYLVKYHGTVAEDLINESKKRTIKWEAQD